MANVRYWGEIGLNADIGIGPLLNPERPIGSKFAVMHNGPHDVVGMVRRLREALGETAAHYKA
jgi:hypothetical protein